ncbi:uncharacterized protein LOC143460874 isoform X1 [Clavelina lepadiformis]|uniref:uncharacterized protein LOC143460874 isoform X1 n=1 Tax=Clavelina lepadiformis TaxID=159417 RepID=UPI0040423A97
MSLSATSLLRKSGYNHNFSSGKRSKSGSNHRGRTSRLRKKKSWAQFSRWSVDDFNDDDLELLQFCQSRGLTRATTAPVIRTQNQQTTSASKKGQQKKNSIGIEVSNEKTLRDDPRYITHLCSSLKDKKKFLRDAEGLTDEDDSVKIQNKGPFIKLTKQDDKGKQKQQNTVNKDETGKTEKTNPRATSFAEKASDVKPTTNAKDNNPKDDIKSARQTLPNLKFDDSDESKHSVSPISVASVNKHGSWSPFSGETPRTIPLKKTTREWNAEVESNIMRLYECSGPGAGLPLLDSKPHPRGLANVKEQVETKVSNADHTPSYVLALANLFRRRMQIRKEFSQVSGDMVDTALQGSSIPSTYCKTNVFPQQTSKSAYNSKHQSSSAEGHNKSVSLRYHHVSSEQANGKTSSLSTSMPADSKSSNMTFYSIASPILTPVKIPETIQLVVSEGSNSARQHQNATTYLREKKLQKLDREESKADVTPRARLPFATEEKKGSKEENLDALLTVFPKPPQFKFSGIQKLGNSSAGNNHQENKPLSSEHNGIIKDLRNQPANTIQNNANEILVMSFNASVQKSKKLIMSDKLRASDLRRKADLIAVKSSNSKRQCSSAAQTLQNALSASSPLIKQEQQASFYTNPKIEQDGKANVVVIDKYQQLDKDVSIALVPMSKVRWSGSLGTLYTKSKPGPESKVEIPSSESKLVAEQLPNALDKASKKLVESKDFSRQPPKTDLMTVSPIEKRSAIAS